MSYYWPPAGGPGVQRWLKFVKYLDKEQFKITVVVPKDPDYAVTDSSMLQEVPEGIEILPVAIQEPSKWIKKLFSKKTKNLQRGIIDKQPSKLEKTLLWIRGNLFIPDARVPWVSKVVKELEGNSAFAKADCLITTGPPHSVHLIGQQLQSKKSVLWIADFRDPWTTIGYHKSLQLTPKAAKKHEQLERMILQKADQLLVTSPSTQAEFASKTKTPITLITNGFDRTPNSKAQPEGKFTLAHIGTLLSDRNPIFLWQRLKELCDELPEFAADFELQLAGNVSNVVIESIQECGLQNHLNQLGYVSHQKAIELMDQAQLLLLIEIDAPENKAIIPGKLFEYIASRRPILALLPEGSDVQPILEKSQAGTSRHYRDQSLKKLILEHYESYKQGTLTGYSKDISRYHRERLTQQLADLITK